MFVERGNNLSLLVFYCRCSWFGECDLALYHEIPARAVGSNYGFFIYSGPFGFLWIVFFEIESCWLYMSEIVRI